MKSNGAAKQTTWTPTCISVFVQPTGDSCRTSFIVSETKRTRDFSQLMITINPFAAYNHHVKEDMYNIHVHLVTPLQHKLIQLQQHTHTCIPPPQAASVHHLWEIQVCIQTQNVDHLRGVDKEHNKWQMVGRLPVSHFLTTSKMFMVTAPFITNIKPYYNVCSTTWLRQQVHKNIPYHVHHM